MTRRNVVPLHDDPVAAQVARLRRLLGMLEDAATPNNATPEALERAGFSTAPRPPVDQRLEGRRIVAWIEEREARRLARKALLSGRDRRETR